MTSWFQHTLSQECEECGMPFEDNLYESSPLCKSCLDELADQSYDWDIDYTDVEDE